MATTVLKLPIRTGNSKQSGATLIEVLVSLLILSTGLLGMSGLQTMSLRNTHTSYLRTQAAAMSADIIERMHANAQGAAVDSYTATTTGYFSEACLSSIGCSSSALAMHDLAEWRAALTAGLPDGAGVICRDSSPEDGTPSLPDCDGAGENHAVKIWWDGERKGVAGRLMTVSVRM
jgi:type IV pilus assembly protein PilV